MGHFQSVTIIDHSFFLVLSLFAWNMWLPWTSTTIQWQQYTACRIKWQLGSFSFVTINCVIPLSNSNAHPLAQRNQDAEVSPKNTVHFFPPWLNIKIILSLESSWGRYKPWENDKNISQKQYNICRLQKCHRSRKPIKPVVFRIIPECLTQYYYCLYHGLFWYKVISSHICY